VEISEFLHEIQSDVIATAIGRDEREAGFKEQAFTELVCGELEIAGVLEEPTVCYYQGGVGSTESKINGYSAAEADGRIDVFISLYFAGDEICKVNSADIDRAFRKLRKFLDAVALGEFATKIEPSAEARAMAMELTRLISSAGRISMFLFTNGVVATRKERQAAEPLGDAKVSLEVWDLERFRRLRSSASAQEPIDVDLAGVQVPCVASSSAHSAYQTCVTLLPGSLLSQLYDEHGARLLELNVRSYLQAKGKINRGILETLVREPDRFLSYNNGISIVAEKILLSADSRYVLGMNGIQIVNGGQTTASIHKASKETGADLANVLVQAKITVVPPEKFEEVVHDIARYSNSQNKVSEVDLSANHPYHVAVERHSRAQWAPGEQSKWFYERARGSFQTERARRSRTKSEREKFDREFPTAQRVTKEDLARYSNCFDGLPHLVSKGGQKNFVRFMEGLPSTSKGWEMPLAEYKALIGKAILYRECQSLAKEAGIPSFRINVVTYTVSLLAEMSARRLNLEEIWNVQGISGPTTKLLRDWLPKVAEVLLRTAEARNPTEWFKSEHCWNSLRHETSAWGLSDSVAGELLNVSADAPAAAAIQNSIAKCMQISAETWFRVQMWGASSGKLEVWQCGIANTLAGYAAGGWKKRPSEKQARQGIKILEIALPQVDKVNAAAET
jgi:hypothetical protein